VREPQRPAAGPAAAAVGGLPRELAGRLLQRRPEARLGYEAAEGAAAAAGAPAASRAPAAVGAAAARRATRPRRRRAVSLMLSSRGQDARVPIGCACLPFFRGDSGPISGRLRQRDLKRWFLVTFHLLRNRGHKMFDTLILTTPAPCSHMNHGHKEYNRIIVILERYGN
jgi:hypothetical protein